MDDDVIGLTVYFGSKIYLNMKYFDSPQFTDDKRVHVITHELGHALGLDHNYVCDIMYKYAGGFISLSRNDKSSYDAAYRNY